MISWIQKYFQHHFKAIFAILLAVTIISFIFTIGASPGIGRADRRVTERHVFGYNLASQEEYSRLIGDAQLSAQLQTGYGVDGAELQEFAFQRAASLQLADQLHLPAPSKQEVTDYIKTLRVFTGADGQFDAKRYTTFRDSLRTNPRFTEASVSRVLGDDVRISNAQKLIAGPGYVLPSFIKSQLEQADSTWTLGVATVDYTSYNPSVPTNDVTLTKFFEENAFRYEIPPRVVVSYADFSLLNYLSTIAVTDAEVRAFYDTNPARFPKPAADPKAPAKADPAADFAAVRPQVETALKMERARRAAEKAAADFSFALYDKKLTPGTADFDAYVAAQKVAIKSLAPFARETGPAELGGSREVAEEAFKLGKDRLFSDAVSTPMSSVVLLWKDLEPARKPSFTEVRAKVAADYVDGEKRKRFVELGRTLRAAIETRVKAGDTFEKAVAETASANSVKIDAKMFPAFSRRQPPQDMDYSVFGTLERLEKGRLSDMVIAKDHGLIVYAADKKLPDVSESSPQYAMMKTQTSLGAARATFGEYLGDLVTDTLKQSEPKVQ
jgi:peptidyl-prolyl cis-trans isomerase D